jgi:hypothetical protein
MMPRDCCCLDRGAMRGKKRHDMGSRRTAEARALNDISRLLQRGKAAAKRKGYWSGTVRRVT